MLTRLIALAAVVGAFMTAAGLFAPLYPPADFINHFRPMTAAGCLILAVIAAFARHRPGMTCAIVLLMANSALLLTPMASAAQRADDASSNRLTVLAFNLWLHNPRLDDAIAWVSAQPADIVVLQEVPKDRKAMIEDKLQPKYPYIFDCRCNELLVLSKKPWRDAGGSGRTDTKPSMSWLVFDDGKGGTFRFVGLRTTYPMKPHQQARHYQWMQKNFARPSEPLILAGDFNLTPWSWQLQRFSWEASLKRHGTWDTSWNAKSAVRPLAFLIDNVLTSPEIRSLSFATGPRLGSDHLPVIATLAMP